MHPDPSLTRAADETAGRQPLEDCQPGEAASAVEAGAAPSPVEREKAIGAGARKALARRDRRSLIASRRQPPLAAVGEGGRTAAG